VHRTSDVRQIEIHTAEPLVSEPSPFDVEISIVKLKNYNSPGKIKFHRIDSSRR
jgi:hypothetical protein